MGLQSETPTWDWQQSSRGKQNSAIAGGAPKLVIGALLGAVYIGFSMCTWET